MHDALLALPFGLAIGLLLGLVGGGGSILAVPVLVYILGEPVERATTESLRIVGVTALVGAVAAARAHRVRVRITLACAAALAAHLASGTINLPLSAAFTLAAIAGAVAGTRLHGLIPEPLLVGSSHCCSSAWQHSSSQRTPAAERQGSVLFNMSNHPDGYRIELIERS